MIRTLRAPVPPMLRTARAIVTLNDYPAEALRTEQEGAVAIDLAVTADGTITGCTVAQSSGFPGLDAATCQLAVARGQAQPGTDRYGDPASGLARFRITWKLED